MNTRAKCERCGRPLEGLGKLCATCLAQLGQAAWLREEDPAPTDEEGLSAAQRVRYFGDYELLEEIAHGGMGVVYKARQVSLNRMVAVKMIAAGRLASVADVQRFRTEAEAAAGLDHPNVVPIYEVGEHDGQHYFSMRYVEGGSLAQRMAEFQLQGATKSRSANTERAIQIVHLMVLVARAVHHAHQRGIIHRDLKPGNILIDAKGEPHVTDFGLAKLMEQESDLTGTQAVLGTPNYMSPEQASGQTKGLTTASDVFSLGSIFYQLLSGCPPFSAGTPLETMRNVQEEEPPRLRSKRPELDADLETICLKCLQKEPTRRYDSALALAEDLNRWLAQEPILARRSHAGERVLKWMKRRPAAAALTLSTSGLVAALLGVLFFQSSYKVEQKQRLEIEAALKTAQDAREAERTARHAEETQRAIAQAALREAEQANYVRNLTWAEREWQENDVSRAEQLLDECPDGLRGWEWHYLKRLCHADLLTLALQTNLTALAFSPDGFYLAAGDAAGSIAVFSPQTGEELFRIDDTDSGIAVLAFHPQERGFFSAVGGKIHYWSLDTARRLRTFDDATNSVQALGISPDGRLLVSGGADKTINVWDARSGHLIRTLDERAEPITCLAFSPDGQWLASGSGNWSRDVGTESLPERPGLIQVWQVSSWQKRFTLADYGSAVTCLAFSPDGRHLAAGQQSRLIKLWEVPTFRPLPALRGHSGGIRDLDFSPDGRFLVSGSEDRTLMVWDMDQGAASFTYRGHTAAIQAVTFSPDGKFIASASGDLTLKLWDASSGPEFKSFPGCGQVTALSPDGSYLATTLGDVWNTESKESIVTVDPHRLSNRALVKWTRAVDFSSDGRYFAYFDRPDRNFMLRICQTEDGKAVYSLETKPMIGMAFSPDGKHLATCGRKLPRGGWLEIRDVDFRGRIRYAREFPESVWDVTFSPQGNRVAVAMGYYAASRKTGSNETDAGVVVIIDWSTGEVERTLRGHSFCVWDADYSPDGTLIASLSSPWRAGSEPVEIKIWDVLTGQERRTISALETPVFSIDFSGDGKRLAACSGNRQTGQPNSIGLWDVESGAKVFALKAGSGAIHDVRFSRRNRRLVSTGADGTALLWEAGPATPENKAARRAALIGPQALEQALQEKTNRLERGYHELTRQIQQAGTNRSARVEALGLRVELLKTLGREAEAARDIGEMFQIPPRPADTSPFCVDLSSCYNAGFKENWHSSPAGNRRKR